MPACRSIDEADKEVATAGHCPLRVNVDEMATSSFLSFLRGGDGDMTDDVIEHDSGYHPQLRYVFSWAIQRSLNPF